MWWRWWCLEIERQTMKYSKAIAIAAFCAAIPAYAGPDWIERGDAGSALSTAQFVTGIGVPETISGSLNVGLIGNDFEDLYVISILHPTAFSFSMGNTPFNSQLYLFAITENMADAFGMLSNDDRSLISTDAQIAQSFATDGTGAHVIYKGLYCIAITSAGRYPVSEEGAIFFQATNTEISGPDGPGRYSPLSGWEGPGAGGSYDIHLSGIGYADTPTPGVLSVVAASGMMALRRRR
jgi:hypothetical protein